MAESFQRGWLKRGDPGLPGLAGFGAFGQARWPAAWGFSRRAGLRGQGNLPLPRAFLEPFHERLLGELVGRSFLD